MKCLNCENETARPQDRMCPKCAAHFVSSVFLPDKPDPHATDANTPVPFSQRPQQPQTATQPNLNKIEYSSTQTLPPDHTVSSLNVAGSDIDRTINPENTPLPVVNLPISPLSSASNTQPPTPAPTNNVPLTNTQPPQQSTPTPPTSNVLSDVAPATLAPATPSPATSAPTTSPTPPKGPTTLLPRAKLRHKPPTTTSQEPIATPITQTMPRGSSTPKPPPKRVNVFGIFVVLVALGMLGGLGYFLGIYPYTEAIPIVENVQVFLPQSERANEEAIFQIQNMANTFIESLEQTDQIGRTITLSQELAKVEYKLDTYHMQYPILPPTANIAGAQIGVELAYDPYIEEQTQQTQLASSFRDEADKYHTELVDLREQTPNMWVARRILLSLDPVIEKGDALLDEINAIVQLQEYNIDLVKRLDDMSYAIETAFVSQDANVVEKTLRDNIEDLKGFQIEFENLAQPSGAEEVFANTVTVLDTLSSFYEETETAILTDDINRMISATNQFFVNISKYSNKFDDDEKTFWKTLPIGTIFNEWKEAKDDAIEQTHTLEENTLYKFAQRFVE